MRAYDERKTSLSENQAMAWFAGDVPGGIEVGCDKCPATSVLSNNLDGTDEYCSGCGRELMYNDKCSW